MNLVNYIKEIPTKPYKPLVLGILFLSLFILSSCNRIQFNNQSSCITILYSKEHQGIIKILENKFAQNNHFKFDKIDREKSKELLLKNPNSIYIGSIDSLIESDDEINKILIAKDSLIFVVNPTAAHICLPGQERISQSFRHLQSSRRKILCHL